MDYHHLFTEFNVGTTHQACLNTEVRIQTKYCLSERRRLESECEKQADFLKARDAKVESLKAQLLLKEAEAAKAAHALKQRNVTLENEKDSLDGKVHALETTCSGLRDQVSGYEQLKEQIEEFQDAQMNVVNKRVAKLDADLLEMAYYLTDLGDAISRAVEQGMQSGLAAGIDHGKEGRSLRDSHKDASVEDVMNLLCLEGPLADAPGMSDLQPDVEQLRVPIHRSKDQVVLGETSLSFALSVSHSRMKHIRENIAAQRLDLIGIWNPLSEPLSVQNLTGAASISDSVPVSVATTTALSTTFASASSIPPITIEDNEIANADGQEGGQKNV
ncbi:hypothetical protein Tco_0461096 [Tanacetum coccineum]